MASKTKTVNMGGLDLVVNRIRMGVKNRSEGDVAIADTVAEGVLAGRRQITSITADDTKTLTANDSGTLFLLNKATGIVFTLPAPEVGLWFEFQVNTSVTSNAYKWSTATQGTDFFNGNIFINDSDTAASLLACVGNGSTHDNISMNGTTTGGLAGTRIRIECISSTVWTCSGINQGSGAVATPFATT